MARVTTVLSQIYIAEGYDYTRETYVLKVGEAINAQNREAQFADYLDIKKTYDLPMVNAQFDKAQREMIEGYLRIKLQTEYEEITPLTDRTKDYFKCPQTLANDIINYRFGQWIDEFLNSINLPLGEVKEHEPITWTRMIKKLLEKY